MKKRNRPTHVESVTFKQKTSRGNLYVTAGFTDGLPFEVFITQGKSGSQEKGYAEALGVLISNMLQMRIEEDDIRDVCKVVVKSLKNIAAEEIIYDQGRKIKSVLDAIAQVLEEIWKDFINQETNNNEQNE